MKPAEQFTKHKGRTKQQGGKPMDEWERKRLFGKFEAERCISERGEI